MPLPSQNSRLSGRGSGTRPANRFKPLTRERDAYCQEAEGPLPGTEFLADQSRSVLSTNDSPDVGFDASLNPYRGCEHGCVYCYARPTHEFFELSAGLDFETKILVKERAPQLLEATLTSPRWRPQVVALSGVTDCYQPGEKVFGITRKCLEVLLRFRNPVAIVTKSHLVTRDVELLAELAQFHCAAVYLSITTLDAELCRRMEPRAASPRLRLEAIRTLNRAGVPVGIMCAPVIPGLTDHELPDIIKAAADEGAGFAGYIVLRLPFAVKDLFADWLARHYPTKADKVLNRIRALRGGKLNDARFQTRMKGEGVFAREIANLFRMGCKRGNLTNAGPTLSTGHFQNPHERQRFLFA